MRGRRLFPPFGIGGSTAPVPPAPPPSTIPTGPHSDLGSTVGGYQIRVKDTSGTVVAILDNFIRLSYTKQVNKPGYFSLWMWGDDERIALFDLDFQLEVWRNIPGQDVDWYLDFEGFHRTPVHQRTSTGPPMFTSYGRGYNDLLSRRHILYDPDTVFVAKSGVGETVMKEYVDENAGPSATSPPRLEISGVTTGLTVEADAAAGGVWSGARTYKNLITVCQEIAFESGIDFQVEGTGPATYQFSVFDGQLGEDRTVVGLDPATGLNGAGNPPVIFTVKRGNMSIPIYTFSRNDEINTLLVLGPGQGADRLRVLVQNGDESDSPWNQHEGTRQSGQQKAVASLTDKGNELLEKLGSQETFTFDVEQVPSTIYGRDYNLGDLVTGRFTSGSGGVEIERNKKIVQVEVQVAADTQRGEFIRVELGDVPFG